MMGVICSGFLVAHRRENMKCTIFPQEIIIVPNHTYIPTWQSIITTDYYFYVFLLPLRLITMIILMIFALGSLYVNIWREKKPTRRQA